MKRHSPFNLFIVGLATAAITVLPMPWVQRQISTRYLVLLLEVALGLPCLVVLAVRQPVAVPDPVAVGAPPRAKSRQEAAAVPVSPLADPGRTQLAARVALGFLAVAVVAALLSDRIGLSFFGQRDWANGALLTIALAGMWALGVGLGEEAADLLEQCLVAAVLVNAAIAVVQGATGLGLVADRAPGLLDNPVYLAPLLVGGLWLVIRRLPTNLLAWGAAVALLAAAIQTSGSRSALLLLPVVLLGTARLQPKRMVGITVLCLAAGLVVGGLAAKLGEDSTSSTSRTVSSISGDTLTTRIEVWSMATHVVRDHPLLGAGPGRFLAATGKYTTLKLTKAEGLDSQFVDAHNLLVEYGVTTGLIGLALLVAFLVVAFGLSGWGSPLAGFAILALAMHLFEPQDAFVTPVVFLALGAAVAGKAALSWRSVTLAQVLLVAVAVEQALLLTLANRTLYDTNGPLRANEVAATYDGLHRATWQAPFWAEPISRQADLDEARAQAGDTSAPTDAVRHRREATKREPDRMRYWAQLGLDEQQANNVEGAKAAFKQALAVNPWAADVQLLYAKLLLDGNNPDDKAEARRQLEHAILALPDPREAQDLLAQLGPG